MMPGSVSSLVVDVDVKGENYSGPDVDKAGEALAAVLGGAKPFLVVKTPSGGRHLWYRIPADREKIGNRKWACGGYEGDIRGDHGFVILWNKRKFKSDVTGSDAGDVLAPRLLEKIRPLKKRGGGEPARGGGGGHRLLPPLDELDFSEGKRNETLNYGVFRRASWGQTWDDIVEAARAAGLPEGEIKTTVTSAAASGRAELEKNPDRVASTRAQAPTSAPPEPGGKLCYDDKNVAALKDALQHENVAVRYNIRAARVEVEQKDAGWQEMTDRIAADLRERIAEKYLYQTTRGAVKLRFGRDLWRDKLNAIIRHNEVDAFIVDFLDYLPPWDRVDRLDFYLDDLFSAGKSELVQWGSRVLLLGAITRAYIPGAKLDETPVFVGDQGIGKSAFLRALLPDDRPEWFADGLELSAHPKEVAEAMLGRVLIEVSEMAGSTRGELERIKAILTRRDDGNVRLAYRENPETLLRRVVLAGTTNRTNSLPNDPSGNRRFVPIQLYDPNRAVESFIVKIREQLWAEALHRYRAGESPRLPRELHAEAAKDAEANRNRDELLEDLIEETLEAKRGIDWTSAEWASHCNLCNGPEEAAKVSRPDQKRLVAALENKGLERKRTRRAGKLMYLWIPAENSLL